MEITIAQIKPKLGNIQHNLEKIQDAITKAKDIIIFPELALTGYPLQDVLFQKELQAQLTSAIEQLKNFKPEPAIILGYPKYTPHGILNAAGVIYNRSIIHEFYKNHLADFECFNESRYFIKKPTNNIITIGKYKFALTICYDLWNKKNQIITEPVNAIISINASPYDLTKDIRRNNMLKSHKNLSTPIIYTNLVGAQDSLIFDGASRVMNAHGKIIRQLDSFKEQIYNFDLNNIKEHTPKTPPKLQNAIILGIKDYFYNSHNSQAFIGISGGLDSAVVAALTAQALGSKNVTGIMMPSIYTSQDSLELSKELCTQLNIKLITESIDPCFNLLKTQLASNNPNSNAEQNLQARIRGIILMYYANKNQGLVVNTGNKSELAMGYCTLYGDMIGALAPIGDLTKTQVIQLAHELNIPQKIINRAPSAELAPNQKDSDSLPEYHVLDKSINKINNRALQKTIQKHEHKRQQGPMLLKLSESCFTVDEKLPRLLGTTQ